MSPSQAWPVIYVLYSYELHTALVFLITYCIAGQFYLGSADDIPHYCPCADDVEVGSFGYPFVANHDQYWSINAFHHWGAIPLYTDFQDKYVISWQTTEYRRDYSWSKKRLMFVSYIDNHPLQLWRLIDHSNSVLFVEFCAQFIIPLPCVQIRARQLFQPKAIRWAQLRSFTF